MIDVGKIKKTVKKLKNNYSTNPFDLAKELKINLMFEDLDNICGTYKICLKRKYIVLSEHLSDEALKLVLLHEIGHSILHKSLIPQFKVGSHTLPRSSVYETEADLFALEYLGEEFFIENMEEAGITPKRFRELERIIRKYY